MGLMRVLYFVLIFLVGIVVGYFFVGGGVTGAVIEEPSDFFDNGDVLIYDDEVVLKISNARLANYDDTGSMAPLLGEGANGIVIAPSSEEEIGIGDVISFRREGSVIVHRVVERGEDSEGVYFVTRGDNNDFDDGVVRFGEVEGVLVGVLY